MTTKLDWKYQDNCAVSEYHAFHNGHRIRAVHDSDASNPFTDGDCNWPIVVRSPDARHDLTTYLFGEEKNTASFDMDMFNDAALIHNQVHIAKLFGWADIPSIVETYGPPVEVTKYHRNATDLRYTFEQALQDVSMPKQLDMHAKLFEMAGWPCHLTTVRGYSQGDWAEVLVVATPEAVAKFGSKDVKSEDLAYTANLYKSWAYGDVYGYIIEKQVNSDAPAACDNCANTLNNGSDECDQCGGSFEDPKPEWEEIENGSCWGYYGTDFAESGLEEAALECIPEKETEDA